MKSQLLGFGSITILLIIGAAILIIITRSGQVNQSIATGEGSLITFENYNIMLMKTFEQSIGFISQRAAYELGMNGGGYGAWSKTSPQMADLEKMLEDKITASLPSLKDRYESKEITWGYGSIDVKDYDIAPCGPIKDSNCFRAIGSKQITIYDSVVDSKISTDKEINSMVNSNYFKLLYAGRKIISDPTYTAVWSDVNAIKNLLNTDFGPNMKVTIVDKGSFYEVTLWEECQGNGGGLVPFFEDKWQWEAGANILAPSRGFDRDWGTFLEYRSGPTIKKLFINYTIPNNAIGALIVYKINPGDGALNFVYMSCFDYVNNVWSLPLIWFSPIDDEITYGVGIPSECLHGSTLKTSWSFRGTGANDPRFYEQFIFWNTIANNEYYCLAPLKKGETGIILNGKQIPYDYLKLKFDVKTSDIIPEQLQASIASPTNMDAFNNGDSVTFNGLASGGTPPYTYSWTSSIDGNIGNSETFNKNDLSVGDHTITFKVTDSDGVTDTAATGIGVLNLPSSFDWRNKGGIDWMTSVKNQGTCGSCWAFGPLGAIEAKYNIQEVNPNLDIDLSEQYLLDCSVDGAANICGNCASGNAICALDYIKSNGVIDDACFPYAGSTSNCNNRCVDWDTRLWKISDHQPTSSNRVTIKQLLIDKGPLFASMLFGPGIWNPITYDCPFGTSNHGAVIVGYNDAEGVWLVKNSWGPVWNGDGYFKVKYGACNIESDCHYVEGITHIAPPTCASLGGAGCFPSQGACGGFCPAGSCEGPTSDCNGANPCCCVC